VVMFACERAPEHCAGLGVWRASIVVLQATTPPAPATSSLLPRSFWIPRPTRADKLVS
jgi:hypothetical protein